MRPALGTFHPQPSAFFEWYFRRADDGPGTMATRILVVDDSPTIRAVVSSILERSGYEVKVATDGLSAYDALASGQITADVLLVDFVMPRMNGYQLCVALRQHETLKG